MSDIAVNILPWRALDKPSLIDWGVLIEETMGGEIDVYLVGQGTAQDPPDQRERDKALALLLRVVAELERGEGAE